MLTSFTKDNAMRANELIHQVEFALPAPYATLITRELGLPSFRSSLMSAWYARAHYESLDVPFALRCDKNGNWSMVVGMQNAPELSVCMGALVPDSIEIIELRGREARAA